MNSSDIEKIHQAGLITPEQKEKIITHFKLNSKTHEQNGKFLGIVSLLGGFLVICGIMLLIAANWNQISDSIKLFMGLSLMIGTHAAGYYLREKKNNFPKLGEALYLIGSGLFLGNLALIGQIYNLSSRIPNIFLTWAIGITPLAWIVRSKVQHVLSLIAFTIWFGCETFSNDGLIQQYYGSKEIYLLFYFTLLGLFYFSLSSWLRKTSFAIFSGATQKIALMLINFTVIPFMLKDSYELFRYGSIKLIQLIPIVLIVLINLIPILIDKECSLFEKAFSSLWIILIGVIVRFAPFITIYLQQNIYDYSRYEASMFQLPYLVIVGLFFLATFLQTRVGIQLKSPFMINFALVTIGFIMLLLYISLFRNMSNTGLVFLGAGVFMLVMAVFLEKQRRSIMKKL